MESRVEVVGWLQLLPSSLKSALLVGSLLLCLLLWVVLGNLDPQQAVYLLGNSSAVCRRLLETRDIAGENKIN